MAILRVVGTQTKRYTISAKANQKATLTKDLNTTMSS